MYGSVTAKDIAAALAEAGHVVDRRKLVLKEPIRALGTHEVAAHLAAEIHATFKIEVVKA
jgi:large subunit ribosomal protein L9